MGARFNARDNAGSRYPALDGLRGVAVLSVLLYHGGIAWAAGGFLGVEIFFVLSGFLITSLLVADWQRSGTIGLRAFWGRRARRLLPALLVLVTVIGVYYAVTPQSAVIPGFLGNGLSALLYYSNWHQLAVGTSYFAQSGLPSPFEHTWSLAIEEQFYLVWPLAVLAILSVARRRAMSPRRSLQLLMAACAVGAVAATVDCALLFRAGRGLDRVYYGTDTRASGLLAGACLAVGFAIVRGRRGPDRRPAAPIITAALPAAALGGVVAIAAGVVFVRSGAAWLYPGGMVALDVLVGIVIAGCVMTSGGVAARVLGSPPLCALGLISYGLYLWHFPLFLWLDAGSTGLQGASLLGVRLGVTVVVSVISYVVVEQPIRRRRVPTWLVRGLSPLAMAGAASALVAGSAVAALPSAVIAPDALLPPAALVSAAAGPACHVRLTDQPGYGVAPVPLGEEAHFELVALNRHVLSWHRSIVKRFDSCPPKRVLVVGDSVAFTLGLPMMVGEQRWGVEIANASLLGCGFTTNPGAQIDVRQGWQGQSTGCTNEVASWTAEARSLHAATVVVELGYRDEFDWRIHGRLEHLGQPGFDAGLQAHIDRLVQSLTRTGAKVLLLTVPYAQPAPFPDGSPAPAGSPARHARINALLSATAARYPGAVQVLDVDRFISPGNHYDLTVRGHMCRFDGVHFTLYCGSLLEAPVLGAVLKMTGDARHAQP